MTFASFDLFHTIEATFATSFSGLDCLTIDDAERWFLIASFLTSHTLSQCVVECFPRAIFSPHIVVVPDMPPVRKIFWQHSPLAGGFGAIKDRIDDFAQVDCSLAAWAVRFCGEGCNNGPFHICAITGVAFLRLWLICCGCIGAFAHMILLLGCSNAKPC